MDNVITTYHMQEKKEGRGEDSDPILSVGNDSVLTGVFDGMGGAGAAECESDFTRDGIKKTKAYVGSRIIRDAIRNAIKEKPELLLSSQLSKEIERIIIARYAQEKENHPPKSKVSLRSALIKEYPTTLAITCITQTETDYIVKSLWAGDSRNYIWKKDGLFQISVDDLKGNLDPMQNLRADAPMSNCIQADAPFTINDREIKLNPKEKFVVISATDGCFGYYPSPMDFEMALVEALKKSSSIKDFKEYLTDEFASVTADDFSFAIVGMGYKDFKDMKRSLGVFSRSTKAYFEKCKYNESQIRKFEEKIQELKSGIDLAKENTWSKYKQNYLKYMDSYERRRCHTWLSNP